MDPFRDKLAPTYDELPEVVHSPTSPANTYYTHHGSSPVDPDFRDEPGAPIPAVYDSAEKEVLNWNDMVSPMSPTHHYRHGDGSPTASSGATSDQAKEKAGAAGAGGGSGNEDPEAGGAADDGARKKPKLICGIAAKTFWFIVVVAVVVVAAAVGGGVGGGIAAGQNKSAGGGGSGAAAEGAESDSSSTIPPPASSSISSSTPTSSSPSTTSSTTPSASPSANTFSFQAFSSPDFRGNATAVIQVEGELPLPFNSSSYIWKRGGTGCCVTFCIRKDWVGWWCQDKTQERASKSFDNVEIGCTGEESEAYSKAKCAT